MARQFRVLVDSLTLPGAGMQVGVISQRPFAYKDESVSEGLLGDFVVGQYDAGDEATRRLIEEIEPSDDAPAEVEAPVAEAPAGPTAPASEEPPAPEVPAFDPSVEPWEGYDSLGVQAVVDRLKGASPEEVEQVKAYEALHENRSTIINYEPESGDSGS